MNRFVVEAILGLPITPYGAGNQARGFIALEDSMQSLRLAIENPARAGQYRVLNQFDAAYTVNQLAEITQRVASEFGHEARIEHPSNPRVEAEQHYYNPIHEELGRLGYQRTRELEDVLRELFRDLGRFRRRLERKRDVVLPQTQWRSAENRRPSAALSAPTQQPGPPASPESNGSGGPAAPAAPAGPER